MAGDNFGVEVDNIDWDTEDELEIENIPMGSHASLAFPGVEANMASSSAGPSNSKTVDHFIGMGFSAKMVAKAIEDNGEENTDSILETLLTLSALENSPPKQQHVDTDDSFSDYEGSFLDDFSDLDSDYENEATAKPVSDADNKMTFLVDMGYSEDEAYAAIERCGVHSSIAELTDFISAAQISKAADVLLGDLPDRPKPKNLNGCSKLNKRRHYDYDAWKKKKPRCFEDDEDETIRLPNPMIGFGVPNELCLTVHRKIPEAAMGPPYFYYENVALAPKGVWNTISRFLYDVEPEFVDSKYFCAAARKRGYVHNLPIHSRFPLLPLPPHTVHEALPLTRKWWPSWDTRTQLNCLQTCIGSARLTDRIRKALEDYDGIRDPPLHVQKFVVEQCRKWNLVWVGKNKVAPLEPDEVEMLLGFPKNHTRGGGISRTDRYKSLGNSFQVDTVAYHLSVLKDMFPGGINLLSLFSGIGGAEVALHRLGIPLKNVVSVDISEVNRNIVRSWWEQTNQKGTLIDLADVQELDADRLQYYMNLFGGFDLVVGGSPCNNLTGSNRYTRDGLEGKESILFYDYFRILDLVKCIATKTE
ncbi:hypothetical protein IC582_008782 [Cucumis melo]|uniref:DNA (cytosine-5-)-methyltransferase n=2 Tax=Cucumis melo TaxID=3656 RepID=A0A1S3B930_CUCME|nr:DNA (cytosine-5)-methyltransferase DRM2 isoform X1 [Cucumis melo]